MSNLKNQITAWILLGFLIPGIIGFAFIHHHCTGCESNKTEALLAIIPHEHDQIDCFCQEVETSHCAKDNENKCTCHNHGSSSHDHSCSVDFKRFDITGTDFISLKSLPRPAVINNFLLTAFDISPLIHITTQNPVTAKNCFTGPPLIQNNLPVLNSVFRL